MQNLMASRTVLNSSFTARRRPLAILAQIQFLPQLLHDHFHNFLRSIPFVSAFLESPAPQRSLLRPFGGYHKTGVVRKYVAAALSLRHFIERPLGTKYEQARVTFTGGYVRLNRTSRLLVPKRFRLGLLSMPAEGRTFFNIAQIDLLPQLQSILKKYERYSF